MKTLLRGIVDMKRLTAALSLLTSVFTVPTAAAGIIYDLKADWSDTSNPNGVWTLRESSNALPFVADWMPLTFDAQLGGAYNVSGHIAQPAWAPTASFPNVLPVGFRSTVTPTYSGLDWQVGDIIVQTTDPYNGIGKGDANVLWISPSAGTAHVFGNVWDARTDLGRVNIWELWIGQGSASSVFASGSLAGSNVDAINRANPALFDFSNVALSANDTVMLKLYRGGEVGDFIGVNLTIDLASAVPEPATLALLALGLAGLGVSRRRKSAQA